VVAVKDTSLGQYIIAPGLTRVNKAIYGEFHNQVQSTLVIALIYVVVNLILTALAVWVQRRFVGEKRLEVPMVGAAAGDDALSRGGAPV
jgi:glutamate transport system permease protein